MKVLIPFSYYYPENCAGISIVDDLMHRLAAGGDECVLYVPVPTRAVKDGAEWHRDEYLCGGRIHIHRFRMWGEGENPLLRALRYVLCEFYYLHRMLWDRYDAAFIDSTPPIQGLKLPVVRLFRRIPVVYNAQDLFPETLGGAGLARRGGWLWKTGEWVAKVTFSNSDRIIAISDDIKRSIVAKGVPESKVEVVYNWVDGNAVTPVPDELNPLFDEFGIRRDRFRVVYAGNLGNAQNTDIIVEAAGRLKDVEFIIFGTGGQERELKDVKMREHIDNLTVLPLQPYGRVSQVYSLGDVCVVSCRSGLGGASLPSKTWSIMSAGRAVLASFDEGELRSIIEGAGCGLFTLAGDADAFTEAVRTLASDPDRCSGMGLNGRRFVLGHLSKEAGTGRYVEVLESAVRQMKLI